MRRTVVLRKTLHPPRKSKGLRNGESGSTAPIPSSKVQAGVPDVMADVLAMVGADDLPAHPPGLRKPSQARCCRARPRRPRQPRLRLRPRHLYLCSHPRRRSHIGKHFMAWLQQGIASRRLIINDAKALVHTVSDAAYLVSPGVFQRYAQEHPQVGMLAKQDSQQGWQWVQKRFERHSSTVSIPERREIFGLARLLAPGGLATSTAMSWTMRAYCSQKRRQTTRYLSLARD